MVEEFINKVCSKIRDNRYYYSMNRENEFAVDCSWLLITSLKEVGVDVHGATYTGNMEKLTGAGFKRIIIKPGTTFQRGDILVKHISGSNGHTVLYLGNNQIAEACNKKNGLRITAYYPNGYQYILRFDSKEAAPTIKTPETIRKGSKNINVGFLQLFLNYYYNGRLKVDCDFGQKTFEATKNAQLIMGFQGEDIDGIVGVKTWTKIYSIMAQS